MIHLAQGGHFYQNDLEFELGNLINQYSSHKLVAPFARPTINDNEMEDELQDEKDNVQQYYFSL